MKKEFKLVSASVIGLVCASLMTPSFAATVRTLGGTGTYTGTSSATQAASASKTATTARAGSVRVGSGTRVAAGSTALRTPSTRSATAPRLSIGKYLSTNSSLGTSNKVVVENSSDITDIKDQITDIKNMELTIQQNINNVKNDLQQEIVVNVDGLREELQTYAKDFTVDYVDGVLIITRDGKEPQEISLFDKQSAEDKINEMIAKAIQTSGTYSAGDGVTIGEDNKISANIVAGDLIDIRKDEKTGQMLVSADIGAGDMIEIKGNTVSAKIVGALTGALEQDGLVTATQVVNYAIPKPQAACGYTTCVLSFQNGQPYWLELVDDLSDGNDGGLDQPEEPIEDMIQETEIITE